MLAAARARPLGADALGRVLEIEPPLEDLERVGARQPLLRLGRGERRVRDVQLEADAEEVVDAVPAWGTGPSGTTGLSGTGLSGNRGQVGRG